MVKKFILILITSLICSCMYAQVELPSNEDRAMSHGDMFPGGPMRGKAPKKAKAPKQERTEEDEMQIGKVPGKVYVFAFSEQFGDSVVYLSQIGEIDSLTITKKNKFLPYRSDISEQFREHLEKHRGLKLQTASVFFSDKRSKLSKKYYKLKKRYLEKDNRKIEVMTEGEFQFVHPLDHNN